MAQSAPSHSTPQKQSADGLWKEIAESSVQPRQQRSIVPQFYRVMALDRAALATRLGKAPLESKQDVRTSPVTLTIPLPYGRFGRFSIVESPIMAEGLAARYPEIHTYLGQGIDDPSATLRFDLTPQGFHAQVLSTEGTIYVDPYQGGDVDNYIAYDKDDYARASDNPATRQCTVHGREEAKSPVERPLAPQAAANGDKLRTYRLALSATGEYTAAHGGTVNDALSGMVSTLNRVDGIYEHDLAIRMVLINDTDKLIFTDGTTDPFTNNDGTILIDENQTVADNLIGSANYDIGHVFSTGGGGIAGLGVVCSTNSKANGVTGLPNPVADGYDIDFVAHEMGHQFGGDHTFNSTAGSCGGGNRSTTDAYETGSGVTIMAYAGICTTEDLQPHSEDYFHRDSLDEILAYVTSAPVAACPVITNTGNHPPTVTPAAAAFTIPSRTPFLLSATGSDVDTGPADGLTYVWEEFDLGTSTLNGTLVDSGNRPLFRAFDPITQPVRVFPSLRYILNNANVVPATAALPGTTTSFYTGELLPTTSRAMKFRVTARDNRAGGGGISDALTTVTTVAAAGPFQVTSPNTAVSWNAGDPQTVTWNVAGTDANGIATTNVRITLSLDGGYTWPVELAASVPNNGSANVTVPANTPATAQARVRVEAIGNIFFDVSDVNFSVAVTGGDTAPTITPSATHLATRQGSPAVTDEVATVADTQDAAGSLSVSLSDYPQELTVSAVNSGGHIQLTAQAACTLVAPTEDDESKSYPVRLTVTDSHGGVASALVYVDVQANQLPTLGDYTNQVMSRSATVNVATSAAATDPNGNFSGMSVTPSTLPGGGTVSIAPNGTVTVNTAAGTNFGTHKVRAIASDICGASAVRQFLVQVVSPDPLISLNAKTITTDNHLIEPNECNAATLTLGNGLDAQVPATAIAGALTTSTPGVTVTPASSAFPNIAPGSTGSNTSAYQISTDNTVACFTDIAFTQTVTYAEGGSPKVFNFTLPVGRQLSTNYDFTATTGNTIPTGSVTVGATGQADDVAVPVVVPFPITIYGTTVPTGGTITVTSNGVVQLAAGGTNDWGNGALPASVLSTGAVGAFPPTAPTIFVFWDDLRTTGTGRGIFTLATPAGTPDTFMIEWKARPVSGTTALDFALVFHKNSNLFDMIYVNAAGAAGDGSTATIGVQDGTSGAHFTQYSLNTATLASGTKLTSFFPPAICNVGAGVCAVVNDVIFANGFEVP